MANSNTCLFDYAGFRYGDAHNIGNRGLSRRGEAMKIKMHKEDVGNLGILDDARADIEDAHPHIKAGSLKQGDVRITWKKDSDYITVESKDIEL
jgi:hypothetical protein